LRKPEAVSEAGRTWQIFDRLNRQTGAHDDEEIDILSVLCKKILVGGCNALVEKSDVGLKQQVEAIECQSCGHSFVEHNNKAGPSIPSSRRVAQSLSVCTFYT
jgi:hypothetical protein